MYSGDNLSREPLLESLARAVVARFENPFKGTPRALFLAKRDGARDDLAAECMGHGTHGRRGEQNGLTNNLQWWCARKGMHPEKHARDGTGRELTPPVAHDCPGHELEEGVLHWGYVQNGSLCSKGEERCRGWRCGRRPS